MSVKPLPPEDLAHVLEHTRELWAEARDRSFFVTGGTGFFGMWLLESFAYINDSLGLNMLAVVLSRDPAAFARKAPHLTSRSDLRFIQGDVRSFTLPTGHFDYIVHAATEASVKLNQEDPQEMFDAIIGGTRQVLDLAAQCRVKKFLLTSSGAVYGKQPSEITHVSEDYQGAPDPLLPSSAYGEGKRVSEHLCAVHARQHGYAVKIARCFAFVGPHLPLDSHFAIGNFIRDALRDHPIQIAGDGTPMRSYLYASDLAIWLWTLLFRAPSARAYNVGSADDLSIKQLASLVATTLSGGGAVTIARQATPNAPVSRYVPAANRAQEELGLVARVSLPAALQRTAAWLQDPLPA
ncbi:MAG: NAD-dependent epimerase/dehydratase family protein [Opitutus sp.]|nr:NAD-dependent epimerase/dehydratase family protein [Opitutus sp.]MCS6277749.1 NAD-dependent epimerase/dehydratase family protein [Opitutus sp.]MCS6299145.1 NAD-dependent epimerase/dehydratase family protein [Opitutus sp.]